MSGQWYQKLQRGKVKLEWRLCHHQNEGEDIDYPEECGFSTVSGPVRRLMWVEKVVLFQVRNGLEKDYFKISDAKRKKERKKKREK